MKKKYEVQVQSGRNEWVALASGRHQSSVKSAQDVINAEQFKHSNWNFKIVEESQDSE